MFQKHLLIPRHLRSQWAALIHDSLMIPIAWFLAYWLRYNLQELPRAFYDEGLMALAVLVPVQILSFHFSGLYKGIWRFASLPDILRILKAVFIGIALSMVILFIITRAHGIPRSVPILHGILLIMFLGGSRLFYRWLKDNHLYLRNSKRVMIIGSGNAGEMLARDILRNKQDDYQPVVFVDDNTKRLGREIHGISIAGTCNDIPDLVEEMDIDLIMLAIPSAKPSDMRRIVGICETSGIPFRAIPHFKDLVSGHVSVNELRKISIEDLLGRDPVSLDWDAIKNTLSSKTILVTGSGGSIGSELCRQLSELEPNKLILLDSSEFNLYSIEMELGKTYPNLNLEHHLGDVTDTTFLNNVFNKHKPQIVFHAAAYKHVPMLENQIRQAMRNNIIGTRNVADAADKNNAEIFVLVSTDKAVNPANIMGATKRAAEIYCQNLNAYSKTNYVTVRFGNVLGSAGSVIPLFQKQIENGGPVTVTDARMERYFMTIPEACQLIMQTTVLGTGGEIFVLDMGEPVKISYLAEQMIQLSGKTPNEDIEIQYVGLRPGEKLFEELFHEKEHLEGTPHNKVFLARHRKVDWQELQTIFQKTSDAVDRYDETQLSELLKLMVPEHKEKPHITNNQQANSGEQSAEVIHLNKGQEV